MIQGDSNTKYFQMVVNGKRRKTSIYRLQQEEEAIEGEDNLQEYITNYYKNLFGNSERNDFSLDETIRGDITQVLEEENSMLTEQFTEKEVLDAIFQLKHNKAPAPDGFPGEFYQVFWSVIEMN